MELNIGMLLIIMIISIILYFHTQCEKELYSNVRYINMAKKYHIQKNRKCF